MSYGLFGIRRRLGPKLEGVKPPARAKFPTCPELERRQEIARRILVSDGRNVDRELELRLPIG